MKNANWMMAAVIFNYKKRSKQTKHAYTEQNRAELKTFDNSGAGTTHVWN